MTDSPTFGRRGPPSTGASRPPPPRGPLPQVLSYTPAPIEPELRAEWAARDAPRPWPLLTLAITAGLIVIFAAEYWFNVGPAPGLAPGPNSLVALGAMSRNLALDAGEPWRLLTAVCLHLNPAHLIGNAIVLCLAGATLERLAGRAWLGATFVVSGVGGSIAALCFDPAAQISLGASGAIMGLVSAAFICSFHSQAAGMRRTIQLACLRTAIPALIPFSSLQGGLHIDYNAHAGGCIAGVLMGMLMCEAWPADQRHPRLQRLAADAAWTGLALVALSFLMVILHYPAYAQAGERFAGELPALTQRSIGTPAMAEETSKLVQAYPHDPRTHFLRGELLLGNRDLAGAEAEMRAALAEEDAITTDFPALEPPLHMTLAGILLNQGRQSEADDEAHPWCLKQYRDVSTEALREDLLAAGLCGGFQNTH